MRLTILKKIFLKNDRFCLLDDGVYTLAYFHKDSVTSCNKNKEIKKDLIKKTVIIEKDCNKKLQ